ncbi:hypothetical protein EXIGLDRAFT_771605 [Exidia glandulosa HHB12029]|uniref:Uncharacterized protein n=1 Tax=Exidia glandulosa HHB12029 TaxID=1314781 RepID=A0A165FW33_EXIGL|nr:hypothetical protein EXIGLDRAFT_771605 [Exidia glandulosa HHB12029]
MAGAGGIPGFHPHLPSPAFRWAGKGLGAVMWFFIFYRVRKDGASKMLGQHSFMHGDHGHDEESHH